jgi:hypothetical protein
MTVQNEPQEWLRLKIAKVHNHCITCALNFNPYDLQCGLLSCKLVHK